MAFIYFTVGRKGAGKSLRESRTALKILNSYYAVEKRHPSLPRRIYFSKQKFSSRIEGQELNSDQNPSGHLYYWHSAYDLLVCPRKSCWKPGSHPLHNADVFWDEIADDVPREKWGDLPEEIKQIFSHCRKRSVRIFANTQKYEMVAIDFRRQVDVAFWVVKVMGTRDIDVTRPNPRFVAVLQMIWEFDPLDIENENDPRGLADLHEGFPKFAFYTGKDVSIFDTQYEVPPTKYTRLREVVYGCDLPPEECTDPKHGHFVKHEKY